MACIRLRFGQQEQIGKGGKVPFRTFKGSEDEVVSNVALWIADILQQYGEQRVTAFDVAAIPEDELATFKWVSAKPVVCAFKVERGTGDAFSIVIIDWNATGNYYCVLFSRKHSSPIAEIHAEEVLGDDIRLVWEYQPRKQDGKNEERKAYFRRHVGDIVMHATVPRTPADVDRFLQDLLNLIRIRLRADRLDPEEEDGTQGFPEGAIYEKMHRDRERSAQLISNVKRRALALYGKLQCEVCSFDFNETYGEIGRGFAEAHHVVPLSQLTEGTMTHLEDIALVCSNCHRMLHRARPWLSISDLRRILLNNEATRFVK